MKNVACLLLLILLSSCGYHLGEQGQLSKYKSIALPYVVGDKDGQLTQQIVGAINQTSDLKYSSASADLELKVKVKSSKTSQIDYTRGFNPLTGLQDKQTFPIENRLSLLVEVSVLECASEKVIVGPLNLFTSVNYNYNPNFSQQNLLDFSLGQFNFNTEAKRYAYVPLYRDMAQRVVNVLDQAW